LSQDFFLIWPQQYKQHILLLISPDLHYYSATVHLSHLSSSVNDYIIYYYLIIMQETDVNWSNMGRIRL